MIGKTLINIVRKNNIYCIRPDRYLRIISTPSSHLTNYNIQSYEQHRNYSSRKGFLENLVDTVKQEFRKDPELQKNIEKFRQDSKELEDSEALQKARHKFQELEKEASGSTQVMKEALGKVKSKVSSATEDLSKTQVGQGAQKIKEGVSSAAKYAAESEAVKKMQTKIKDMAEGGGEAPSSLYKAPKVLRMRKPIIEGEETKEVEIDSETQTMVMHKDSVWNKQWENLKNSPVGERLTEMKIKYEESDNLLVRGTRFFTDKVAGAAGGMFGGTDVSKVMTEVQKIEPKFSYVSFIDFCKTDCIPNILEALARGDEKILLDWCYEGPATQLMFGMKQAAHIGCKYVCKVIDIDGVDIMNGVKMDQGPVLIVTFQSQQIIYVANSKGEVVEGDASRVMQVQHVWALCRDMEELDPLAGWKLIEQQQQAQPLGF